jgi:succinate-semialdehyde dehydrogenase/glutarate-semialdehyde dehydrogenase
MTIHAHDESRAAVLDVVPRELLIGGRWVPAASSAVFSVLDPGAGAGDILADVADASPADGLLALDAAVEAAAPWAATAPRTRSDILRTVFDLVRERRDHFTLLMTLEMGKPLNEAHGEVDYGAEFLRWFSEEAVRIDGRFGDTPERNGRMVVTRRPVGPCYLITPWNFPLAMATRKIAPALAAGCTVVVKPAGVSPALHELLLARPVSVLRTPRPAGLARPRGRPQLRGRSCWIWVPCLA